MAKEEENDLIICRCEEVSRGEVLQAIAEGAQTLVEIKWRTRAGMGLCQSKTCRRLVSQILAEETGQAMADINPATHRPPVRPVELGVLAAEDGDPMPPSGTPPCVVGTGGQDRYSIPRSERGK